MNGACRRTPGEVQKAPGGSPGGRAPGSSQVLALLYAMGELILALFLNVRNIVCIRC